MLLNDLLYISLLSHLNCNSEYRSKVHFQFGIVIVYIKMIFNQCVY